MTVDRYWSLLAVSADGKWTNGILTMHTTCDARGLTQFPIAHIQTTCMQGTMEPVYVPCVFTYSFQMTLQVVSSKHSLLITQKSWEHCRLFRPLIGSIVWVAQYGLGTAERKRDGILNSSTFHDLRNLAQSQKRWHTVVIRIISSLTERRCERCRASWWQRLCSQQCQQCQQCLARWRHAFRLPAGQTRRQHHCD